MTGGEALSQARDAGCFTVLNHPYALAPWIAFDWTGENYDAVEVWNGGLQFDRPILTDLKPGPAISRMVIAPFWWWLR